MTATKSYSKPTVQALGGAESKRPRRFGSRVAFTALGGLGASLLAWGCAGELDKDPSVFTNAYTNGPNTGTGGSTASTGGSTGTTGGTSTGTGGSTGTTGGTSSGTPPDDDCVAGVLTKQACTACHSNTLAVQAGAGLVLEGANLGARLSTTPAGYKMVTTNADKCVQGALIIDPNTPANSILLKKVNNTQACGGAMPSTGGITDAADLKCITDWINKF